MPSPLSAKLTPNGSAPVSERAAFGVPMVVTVKVPAVPVVNVVLDAEVIVGAVPNEFQWFAYGTVGPMPFSLIFYAVLVLLAWVTLRFTKFGSDIYSVGGNADAARLAGIHTNRIIIRAHIVCSVLASLAGLYLASRLKSGAPWIGKDGVVVVGDDVADVLRAFGFQDAA